MQVQQAIDVAKRYVGDLFAGEGVFNIGLEEVRFDDARDVWEVTIGFSRQWDAQGRSALVRAMSGDQPARTFKTVEIADQDGKVLGLKHWQMAA